MIEPNWNISEGQCRRTPRSVRSLHCAVSRYGAEVVWTSRSSGNVCGSQRPWEQRISCKIMMTSSSFFVENIFEAQRSVHARVERAKRARGTCTACQLLHPRKKRTGRHGGKHNNCGPVWFNRCEVADDIHSSLRSFPCTALPKGAQRNLCTSDGCCSVVGVSPDGCWALQFLLWCFHVLCGCPHACCARQSTLSLSHCCWSSDAVCSFVSFFACAFSVERRCRVRTCPFLSPLVWSVSLCSAVPDHSSTLASPFWQFLRFFFSVGSCSSMSWTSSLVDSSVSVSLPCFHTASRTLPGPSRVDQKRKQQSIDALWSPSSNTSVASTIWFDPDLEPLHPARVARCPQSMRSERPRRLLRRTRTPLARSPKSRLLQQLCLDEELQRKKACTSSTVMLRYMWWDDPLWQKQKGKQYVIQTKSLTFRPPTVFWSQIHKHKSHKGAWCESMGVSDGRLHVRAIVGRHQATSLVTLMHGW